MVVFGTGKNFLKVLLKIMKPVFKNRKFPEKLKRQTVGPYFKKGRGGRRGGG